VRTAPEFEEGILRSFFSQHRLAQNAQCQRMNTTDIAIIEGKESTFITLSYTLHQLVIVNFWHAPIVPNLLFLAIIRMPGQILTLRIRSKSKTDHEGVFKNATFYQPITRRREYMKKFLLVTVSAMMFVSAFFAGSVSPAGAKESKMLEFDTMVGVPQALTGTQNPIRGINGGGLPWTIGSAKGELTVGGHLEIKVQGLVFAAGPNTGSNTVASFRAIVSCLGGDGSIQNVTTDPFPATTGPASSGGGNAKIEADLTLPQPCIAPIIFVTNANGAWFAATGF